MTIKITRLSLICNLPGDVVNVLWLLLRSLVGFMLGTVSNESMRLYVEISLSLISIKFRSHIRCAFLGVDGRGNKIDWY